MWLRFGVRLIREGVAVLRTIARRGHSGSRSGRWRRFDRLVPFRFFLVVVVAIARRWGLSRVARRSKGILVRISISSGGGRLGLNCGSLAWRLGGRLARVGRGSGRHRNRSFALAVAGEGVRVAVFVRSG